MIKQVTIAALFIIGVSTFAGAVTPTFVVAGDNASFSGTITYPSKGTSSSFAGSTPYEMDIIDSNCIFTITSNDGQPLAASVMKDNLVIKSASCAGENGNLIIKLNPKDTSSASFRAASWGQSKETVKKNEILGKLETDGEDDGIKGCGELEYTASGVGYDNIQLVYTFLDDKLISAAYVLSFTGPEALSEYNYGIKNLKSEFTSLYGKSLKNALGEEWRYSNGKVLVMSKENKKEDGTIEFAAMIMYTAKPASEIFEEIKKRTIAK